MTETNQPATSDFYSQTVKWAKFSFAAAGMAVVGVHGTYYFTFHGKLGEQALWGVFGDFLGGTLGPVLNLISIGMLVMTLRFQQQQIVDARKDAVRAINNAELQQRAQSRQSFEQTFFSWLGSYRDIVSAIATPTRFRNQGPDSFHGRDALKTMWGRSVNAGEIVSLAREKGLDPRLISIQVQCLEADRSGFDAGIIGALVLDCYNLLYVSHTSSIDTMFRTLYRLVKWVDSSDLSREEKFNYVGIVRSQISNVEMWYLFANALTDRGEKFFPLLEKYSFFENMDADAFIHALRGYFGSGRNFAQQAFDSDYARKIVGPEKSPDMQGS